MFLYQLLNFFFAASKKEEDSKYDLSLYKRGDLLEVPRTLFTHFGIYLGNNRVAHLIPDILPAITKDKSAIAKMVTNNRLLMGVITKVASVRVDSVADFAYGSDILINHMDKVCSQPPLDGEEVARRAEKLLGSVTYSLLWYNCEHYVMYCRFGMAISYQTYQFCTTVRKILFSRMSAYLTALCGVCFMLYLSCVTPLTVLLTVLISFTIWMAS
ncbi:lecithin retinol acyltransferase family protein [Cyprinodon tularosa]|uniref:Lecithin retinol acyltransferase-like n=1 Tax=Cyprinodon variegatus TaxID=28743 RepID=A0A3Q2FUE8_CYPVA|nr:PREDICTED: lecithin retinol acyltransferase-like [Cyprinodon variegatus]XP_038162069.1 lecithin retinol acyltransferase family protein [Cyprinodon tularosa]